MQISKSALKALRRMPRTMAQRFLAAFDRLEADDTEGLDIKPLKGRDGYLRLRIGRYRAIYTITMELVVVRVGPRGGVYH